MFNCGTMCLYGDGAPKDAIKAIKWFSKAAVAGETHSMVKLGDMYGNGEGVPSDYAKTVEWYTKAANAGECNVAVDLGKIFYSGRGNVAQDKVKALGWFIKAAEEGDVRAMYMLALMRLQGEGGAVKDEFEAYVWLRVADSISAPEVDDETKNAMDALREPMAMQLPPEVALKARAEARSRRERIGLWRSEHGLAPLP